jgi:nitroimidazol reductase NimA-like FMN-containing flavoprotein (pyridoxamine 5'-phosphate oxidase superfamily)
MQNYHLNNRPNREITSESEIQEILKNGKYTTISMCRDNEPYIVTLSYGYDEGSSTLYFHCAKKGLKLDFIEANPTVCATVIEDGGYVTDHCEHNFRSAVFWGEMSIVAEMDEKKFGVAILVKHLESNPNAIQRLLLKSDEAFSRMEILKLKITQIHAKAGK